MLLEHMAQGYKVLRPDAPQLETETLQAWELYVQMDHFRDLYWCSLKGYMEETLKAIDKLDIEPVPMPYRVNSLTYDFWQSSRWPRPFRKIRHIIADLAILSLKGHAPAMVALAKLSARDDIIRLTARFIYFLLKSAGQELALDSQAEKLFAVAKLFLRPEDLSEIDARVASGTWPLEESMVIE